MLAKIGEIPIDILQMWYELGHEGSSQAGEYFNKLFKPRYSGNASCWYSGKLYPEHCGAWHYDKIREYTIICSYPNTTEIFEGEIEDNHWWNCHDDLYGKDRYIQGLVSKGKGKIITPNIGDIYYLPAQTLHRSNPKSYYLPHLVCRYWE